jgi:Putative addiction module component
LKKSCKPWRRFGKVLSADLAAIESPARHEEELAERERNIESGEAKFVE